MSNPDNEPKSKPLGTLQAELKEKLARLDRFDSNLRLMRDLPNISQSFIWQTEEICDTLRKEINTLRMQIQKAGGKP